MAGKWPKKNKQSEKGDWVSLDAFAILAVVFIAVQTLGLFVAKQLFNYGAQQVLFSPNINDLSNALYLFGVIIVMTIIIVLVLRMRRTRNLIWLIEILAVFSTSIVVFSALFPTSDVLVYALTAIVLAVRYTNRQNILIRDLVSLIAVAGAGALIGISLGLLPILAFIIILAIYDIIAVFYTKHMVEIGKAVTNKNFAFTVAIPTKKHTFELGNGDLVIPLIVASSIMVNGPFRQNGIIAGLCLGASYIGLMTSIYTVSTKKIPLPALPPQTALMVMVIILSLVLGL